MTEPVALPKLLCSPEEAAAALTLSRSQVWLLIQSGELPSCKVGRRRRLFVNGLAEYVERLRDRGS